MTDNSVYEWGRAASSNGTRSRALTQYYADSPHLYSISVDGEPHTLPVLTTPDWLAYRDDIDSVLGTHDPDRVVDVSDMDVVHARDSKMAYWIEPDDASDDDDVLDLLWNSDIIAPRLELDAMRIETGVSNYFSSLTLDERLESELTQQLYDHDVPVDASEDQIAASMDEIELPAREDIIPSLPEFVEQSGELSAPFGVNVLTVFNTGDGYELLLSERGEQVAVNPAKLSLIPAGGIKYEDGEPPSVKQTALEEYGEELFDVSEDASVFDTQPLNDLQELFESGDAHLDCTGVAVAASRLGVNIMATLLIDDPEYYDTHVAGGLALNWESESGRRISLDDTDQLVDALSPSECIPPHVACAYEGLLHLNDQYGIETELDLDRQNP